MSCSASPPVRSSDRLTPCSPRGLGYHAQDGVDARTDASHATVTVDSLLHIDAVLVRTAMQHAEVERACLVDVEDHTFRVVAPEDPSSTNSDPAVLATLRTLRVCPACSGRASTGGASRGGTPARCRRGAGADGRRTQCIGRLKP